MFQYRSTSRSWSLAEVPDEIELRSLSTARTMTNQDMEELDFSFQLDSTWPDSIPNHEVPTMNFPIETDIPVPSKYKTPGLNHKLFEDMSQIEIAQSLFVSLADYTRGQIDGAVCTTRRRLPGKLFLTRKTEDPAPGVRIWRVE